MRKTIDPPPSSRCHRCGGLLTLKQADAANNVPGLTRNIFACGKCGSEHAFVAQSDLYAPRAARHA